MSQRSTDNGLRWIADAYNSSFTLTLSHGLSPHELLRSMGAEERFIVPLSRSAAYQLLLRDAEDHISDLDFLDWEDETAVAQLTSGGFLPAPPDTIVRAGAVAEWAYALEEFSCRAGSHLPALSERGQAFCVHRNAKGFSRVDYALHGSAVTSFEPGLPHLTNGPSAEEVLGFMHHDEEMPDVAFLRFLEDKLGICLSWQETEASLPAAAFA
ncbi:DUF6461 domain-containing protein [Streptomyces sp. NPDC087300]|uniref:DUF6461 domain-containing protein n=1 Tax=Streptomyces sp. NPDC087300 TaxID=3365780 RepID=UPI0037FAAC3E